MLIMRHRTHAASASSWERILSERRFARQRYRARPPQGLSGDYAFCPFVAFVAVASACLEVGKEAPGRISADRKSAWSPYACGFNVRSGVFERTLTRKKPKRASRTQRRLSSIAVTDSIVKLRLSTWNLISLINVSTLWNTLMTIIVDTYVF